MTTGLEAISVAPLPSAAETRREGKELEVPSLARVPIKLPASRVLRVDVPPNGYEEASEARREGGSEREEALRAAIAEAPKAASQLLGELAGPSKGEDESRTEPSPVWLSTHCRLGMKYRGDRLRVQPPS